MSSVGSRAIAAPFSGLLNRIAAGHDHVHPRLSYYDDEARTAMALRCDTVAGRRLAPAGADTVHPQAWGFLAEPGAAGLLRTLPEPGCWTRCPALPPRSASTVEPGCGGPGLGPRAPHRADPLGVEEQGAILDEEIDALLAEAHQLGREIDELTGSPCRASP